MEDLTFGEQVKIVLGRKGMTIKQLAELIEVSTGKKMSRQNLTQRLGRDNFQEQDMRMIAAILECPFRLSILGSETQNQAGETVHDHAAATEPQMAEHGAVAAAAAVEPQMEVRAAAAADVAAGPAEMEKVREELHEELQAEVEEVREELQEEIRSEQAAAEEQTTVTEQAAVEEQATVTEQAAAEEQATVTEQTDTAEFRPEEVQPEQTQSQAGGQAEAAADQEPAQAAELEPDERDMTIGELYDMHQELSELEKNAKAGEPVEEIKKELEKPKRDWFRTGGLFLRRRQREEQRREEEQRKAEEQRRLEEERKAQEQKRLEEERIAQEQKRLEEERIAREREEQAVREMEAQREDEAQREAEAAALREAQERQESLRREAETRSGGSGEHAAAEQNAYQSERKDDFEPVIPADEEEDTTIGDVNPYTGREYKSNSVRMHPSRIGYVQVYDRTIHKWTDMTEWAFLGLQERKKALLGSAYEPPIYLD